VVRIVSAGRPDPNDTRSIADLIGKHAEAVLMRSPESRVYARDIALRLNELERLADRLNSGRVGNPAYAAGVIERVLRGAPTRPAAEPNRRHQGTGDYAYDPTCSCLICSSYHPRKEAKR
jgi:hypothetical protein